MLIPKIYNGRNRTFWFFNYEGFRQDVDVRAPPALYPSRAQLEGNLADDSAGTGLFPTELRLLPGQPRVAEVRRRDRSARPARRSPATSFRRAGWTRRRSSPRSTSVTPNVAVPVGRRNFPDASTRSATPRTDQQLRSVQRAHRSSGSDAQISSSARSRSPTRRGTSRCCARSAARDFRSANRLVTMTRTRTRSRPNVLNEFRFGYNRSETYRLSETSLRAGLRRARCSTSRTRPTRRSCSAFRRST